MKKLSYIVVFVVLLFAVADSSKAQSSDEIVVGTPKYVFFQSPTSKEAIVFVTKKIQRRISADSTWDTTREYFSIDGITFHRIDELGSSETSGPGMESVSEVTFNVPGTNREGKWVLRGETNLVVDGHRYTQAIMNYQKVRLMEFPVIREARALLQLSENQYLLVSEDHYMESYDSVKVFMGPLSKMTEVPIIGKSFTRCGSFWIDTAQGNLEYHTPDVEQKSPPLWSNRPVKHLDDEEYTLSESGSTARLVRKTN